MTSSVAQALDGPIVATRGLPLRVSAYMRISGAIRSGTMPKASLLPSEAELGQILGVSRTVIREALILLEEDGLIRSRRGIGRFVSEHLPRTGIERLEPFELSLATNTPLDVKRTEQVQQESSSAFITDFLGITERDRSWFIESIISNGDTPVALTQEHFAGGSSRSFEALDRALAELPRDSTLAGAAHDVGVRFSGTTEISLGTPGASRAALLGLVGNEPVLILTRRLLLDDRPALITKTLINPNETTVSLTHNAI